MASDNSQKIIVLSSDNEYSRQITEDMFRRINDDQLLHDIVDGNEDLPEYTELEEVIIVRCYLPDDQQSILDKFVNRFLNSITETKNIRDFNGWFEFFGNAYSSAYKEHLAILMMTYTAQSFIDWLTLFFAICTSKKSIFAVKRFALLKMRQSAMSQKEQSAWRKLATQLGMPVEVEKEG
jgi:hypothetical protein